MITQAGLYVETDEDPGDCPNRTGNATVCKVFNGQDPNPTIQVILINLSPSPNVYWRYFTPPENQPYDPDWGLSRDQASRLMIAFGAAGRKDLVRGYYWKLVKNGFKHQNGDYLGIGEINNIIRSLSSWYIYPISWIALLFLDLKFLGDLYFRNHTVTVSGLKISSVRGPVWGYDALMCADLYWTKVKLWTPTGFLARKLYKRTDAATQIYNNLINPNTNGCVECGEALQSIFGKM